MFGQFVLFCIGLYTTFFAMRITSLTFRYWIARRIIELQIQKAILTNLTISSRDKLVFDPRTEEIVEQIIIQMCQGLKYQRQWMIRHAIEHMAVLYQTNIWLSNDPDDLRVYEALDVLKQKFYYMHGTFQDIKKSQLRNDIRLDLMTTSGDLLTSVEDVAKYDKKQQGSGCRIRIAISIITPLTSRKYRFFKYL